MYKDRTPRKRKPFFLLVILFAAVLLFLSFWIIRQNGIRFGESLKIYNVTFSTEVDDRLRLTGVVSRFPYGAMQVCLRFDYSKAAPDADIRLLWSFGNKLVQADSYVLSESFGSKIYGLVLENGKPLPRGLYSLSIIYDNKNLSDFRFEIY